MTTKRPMMSMFQTIQNLSDMDSKQFYDEVVKLRRLQRESRKYYHDDKIKREAARQEELIDNEIKRVEWTLAKGIQKGLFD